MRGSDLLDWLRSNADEASVDITDADIRRWTITQVPIQASLRHALDSINRQTAEAACIYERSRASGNRILHGVVTREGIEKFTLGRL